MFRRSTPLIFLLVGLLVAAFGWGQSLESDQSFINVRRYGAKGDGLTDDTRAIQAALDAAEPGGTVYLPRAERSYYITKCLKPKSNTVFSGDGAQSEITVPSAGWALVPGTCYGIVNIYAVRNIRVTGLHIVGTKQARDSNHTPKLIYLQSADNIQIEHNMFENTQFEGIWEGGHAEEVKHVEISNNYFSSCGYGPLNVGLPCIQANMDQAIISNNRLYDVGMGIGASGSNLVISGNEVNGIKIYGVSVGDGDAGTVLITGNHVSYTQDPAGTIGRVAYQADNPVEKPAPLFNFTGNTCRLAGLPGQADGTCFRQASATNVAWTNNTAEISGKGVGFLFFGSEPGSVAMVSGNTCRVAGETDTSECFVAKPNGERNQLTIYSSGNRAYGMTRAKKSWGFDYNTVGGGSLIADSVGDWSAEGFVRIGGKVYNSTGQFDGIPFTLSSRGGASLQQNVDFIGTPFSDLGSPANGTVTYCSDCSATAEGTVCTGVGTGKLAVRVNGRWTCF